MPLPKTILIRHDDTGTEANVPRSQFENSYRLSGWSEVTDDDAGTATVDPDTSTTTDADPSLEDLT